MRIAKLVVLGNRKGCSHCRKLATVLATAAFKAWRQANGVAVEDADATDAPKVYAAARRAWGLTGSFNFPTVVVVSDAGKKLGSLLARGMTDKTFIAAVEKFCPGCGPVVDPVATKTCPTCKGTGHVAAMLCAVLTLFAAGCKTANVRLSLIELDTRSPEQLAAAQYDAGVVFETSKAACQDQTLGASGNAKLTPDVYAELINILPKLKWHIKVLSFESAPVCRKTP